MNAKRLVNIIALALAGVALLFFTTAQAASVDFSWSQYNSSSGSAWDWTQGSNSNWSGTGSENGHRYPGQGTNNSDTATISSTIANPVTLGITILLGYSRSNINALTLSNSGNSLSINSGGILGIQGGSTTTGISNAGTITINPAGTLRNDATSASTHYSIHGAGGITLAGGTISSNAGGTWDFHQAVRGYGTISAPVDNYSTITANHPSTALYITEALNNTAGGILNVGTSATGTFGLLNFSNSGSLSNSGTLNVYGTLNNSRSGFALALTGATGQAYMYGGTLGSTGGGFSNAGSLSGYGTIGAALTNSGTITASGDLKTLRVTGAITRGGAGVGDVNVGANASDRATLDLQNNLQAHNFTLSQDASLKVASDKTISLDGNFYNNATSTSQWPSGGLNLTMSSSTFEVGGINYGTSSGWTGNFNLNTLTVTGTLSLLDDNRNLTPDGSWTSGVEALYMKILNGTGTLDLNHLWVYVYQGGTPVALANGLYTFGGASVNVIDSPVPLPASALLIGSGLLGLGLLRWRRRKS